MITLKGSNTVIGNLAREVNFIRSRTKNILNSILNCKDKSLSHRLNNELMYLESRRLEILTIASCIKNDYPIDSLSIEFLIELCRRAKTSN